MAFKAVDGIVESTICIRSPVSGVRGAHPKVLSATP